MTIKQTAGRDALGDFAPNSLSSMTMCCSARCGAEKTGFPFETAAW